MKPSFLKRRNHTGIAQGLYEAELGAGLCKKRIAIFGQGKRGATRTLVAKESAHGIFFLVGRKN